MVNDHENRLKTLWLITKFIFKRFVFRYACALAQFKIYITRGYSDFVHELCF